MIGNDLVLTGYAGGALEIVQTTLGSWSITTLRNGPSWSLSPGDFDKDGTLDVGE